MLPALGLALVVLLWPQQGQGDPEQTPQGRTRFLGREVAQTMHWTGAPWLLRETRENEENGVLLRRWLAVQPGQVVCDLGCGNGYHTLPLAEAVGPTGRVLAVDLQRQMLELLRLRAEAKKLGNVVLVEAAVDDPKLARGSCDLVLLVDVYHELSHPVRVMAHIRAALKPNGRVVLVEFRAEDPAVPIKPEHKMNKAQVVREMAEHGLQLVDSFDELPWQHAMAFASVDAPGPRFAPQQVLRGFLAATGGSDARIPPPYLAASLARGDLPALAADLCTELRAGAGGRLLASLRAADGGALPHGRDEVVLARDGDGRWFVETVRPGVPFLRPHGSQHAFVAMHTGTGPGTVDEQIALVHELGFDGLAWDLDHLPEVRRACEERGGDLFSAYGVLDLGAGTEERLLPLRLAMQALAGGPGMLWIALRHEGMTARDPAGDDAAVKVLKALLAHADVTGVELALYPHHGFWLETVEDAQRLCARIDHRRLGICFNLCHFLRGGNRPTAPLLASCRGHLFAVTVNGADVDGGDWRRLIRPLGEGTFDLRGFLAELDAVGFDGPIALQGFGIEQPPRDHLAASMAAWRAAQKR
ncbi:MAG TPA: TIM barrel protein, partial [Planctomycetota bacterium]|nr:TIM barrel protein [Planctomycetota bacterium]